MIESFYGNGLVLLGLWTVTSVFMVVFWGLLAWAVVNLVARRRLGRDLAGDPDYPGTCAPDQHATHDVGA